MSLNLHNGYRILSGHDPDSVLAAFAAFAAPLARALAAKQIGRRARQIEAHRLLGLPDNLDQALHGLPPISAAKGEFHARNERVLATRRRDPEVDMGFEASYGAFQGMTLVLLHAESTEIQRLFAETPGVEPWPYWDGTDPDENVPKAMWERRGDAWNGVLDANGYRLPHAFCPPEGARVPTPSDAEITAAFPPIEETARRAAAIRTMTQRLDGEDMRTDAFMKVFSAQDWLSTPEGKAAQAAKTVEFLAALAPVIDGRQERDARTEPSPTT